MIKILIADAQYLVRIGLINLLAATKDFKMVGEAVNSSELIQLTKEQHPDVVIFDYNSEKNFLQEDIETVKKISPKTNFLIISADDSKSNIYKAIELGAVSFLTKECDKEEIVGAITQRQKTKSFCVTK